MRDEPYFFVYDQKPMYEEEVKNRLPSWCKYPLVNADSATWLKFKSDAEFLLQRLHSDPFIIDLIQLRSDRPFNFFYKINDPRIFLFFMIEGIVDFHKDEILKISHARKNRFYVTHNAPDTYYVKHSPPQSIALIVTVEYSWAKKFFPHFSDLSEMMARFESGFYSHEVMPQCNISKEVRSWLRELHSYSNSNPGALNGTLRKYISLVLEHYEKLVREKKMSPAYLAKRYIDANFADPTVNIDVLVSNLAITPKTLTKHFKYEFGFTPYAYLIYIRMTTAKRLMEEDSLKASEVYWQVGYDDVKSFRAAYRKTFGNVNRTDPSGI